MPDSIMIPPMPSDIYIAPLPGPGWTLDAVGQIAGSQAGHRNWTKGGVNTLAVTAGIDAEASRISFEWEQKHELHLSFGLVKQDTLAFRKAEDEIRLLSSSQHTGDTFFGLFSPTFDSQIRTQFAAGFNYKKNPFTEFDTTDVRRPPVKVSDLFSPAILTQTIGLSYDPMEWFSTRLGIGAKETIVAIPRFRPLYGVDPSRPLELELGVESRTELDREIFKNVHLKSALGVFAAVVTPATPDVQWENLITMKVNSWLGVNFEVDTLYDRDLSEAVQLKEVLSLGITVALM